MKGTKTIDPKTGTLSGTGAIRGLAGDYRRARAFLRRGATRKSVPAAAEEILSRLALAMKVLRDTGVIVSLGRACCSSCSGEWIRNEYERLRETGKNPDGDYAFVHAQDLEAVTAYDPPHIHLGHGNVARRSGVAAGHRVCKAIEAAGLAWRWDGTIAKRIEVTLPAAQKAGEAA